MVHVVVKVGSGLKLVAVVLTMCPRLLFSGSAMAHFNSALLYSAKLVHQAAKRKTVLGTNLTMFFLNRVPDTNPTLHRLLHLNQGFGMLGSISRNSHLLGYCIQDCQCYLFPCIANVATVSYTSNILQNDLGN